MSGTVHVERDGDVAVLVIDNPPVNAGSSDVRKALLAAITVVEEDASFSAAVLIGAGKSFIAGSDLNEFDLPLEPPQLPEVIKAIENSSKPFVAAMHGAALGGGYELALSCDARLCAPGTVVGLPEATLGIIPGAGGTQKLPRIVGIAKAIDLVVSGERVPADEACRLGMVDAIADGDLRRFAVDFARQLSSKRRLIDQTVPQADEVEVEASARKALSMFRNRPNIAAAVHHIRRAATVSIEAGLIQERSDFERLRVSPDAKALRHVFFAERKAASGSGKRGVAARTVNTVGIVGAGTMGSGIATAMLQSGYATVLVDTQAEAVFRARKRIVSSLNKAAASGRMTQVKADEAFSKLVTDTNVASLADCDLVIEAVVENLDLKRAVFAELGNVTGGRAILATNTSYLDIDTIAEASGYADQVIGLHFFSPAQVMKLVEVISAEASSDEAVATGLAVVKALGKQPVQTRNSFGFIGNRIYSAYRASCEFMLEDGALPHEVDEALQHFGFAMGPFKVADMSGLDVAWHMRRQQDSTRDPAARYVPIPDKLCELGRFGRKTGAGYYRYDEQGKASNDPDVERLIVTESAAKQLKRRSLSAAEIQSRALAAIVNEAGLVLDEGVAANAGDIDVVFVNGYGFPRWTGGPLFWAGQQNPRKLLADCAAFVDASKAGRRLADLGALGLLADSASVTTEGNLK